VVRDLDVVFPQMVGDETYLDGALIVRVGSEVEDDVMKG
jgi:hypothetical protein